ncbi:MAG: sensor histidine kinase [Bacteroidota bacterium]
MTKIRKSDEELFFSDEIELLEKSRRIIEDPTADRDSMAAAFMEMSLKFESLVSKAKKLIKIGDSSQRKLRKMQLQLRQQNDRINRQNEELMELNSTKDKFFSIISHDLKNPITSILLTAQVLENAAGRIAPEEFSGQLAQIRESVILLNDLFDNLLRWARAQTGKLEFEPEKFYLQPLIRNVIDLLKVNADQKSLTLDYSVEDEIEAFGDKNMIETVIRNLVSNAIKFSYEGGSIQIIATRFYGGIEISVADEGIGISDENQKKLFRIDLNYKTKGTAREGGTGLGLILCKEFVERHGGRMSVSSRVGEGSRFSFYLPFGS